MGTSSGPDLMEEAPPRSGFGPLVRTLTFTENFQSAGSIQSDPIAVVPGGTLETERADRCRAAWRREIGGCCAAEAAPGRGVSAGASSGKRR